MPVPFEELGEVLPGQPQGPQQQQRTSGAGTWASWLEDPVNKAGLLSFGLQMLSGSGAGSFGGELAAGIGKGFEGAQTTEALMHKRREADEEQARKEAESAAEIASREKIAKLGITSREELARQRQAGMLEGIALRNAGMLERAQLTGGGPGGAMTWNQAMQRAMELRKNPLQFEEMTPEQRQEVYSEAEKLYQKGRAPGAAQPVVQPPGTMSFQELEKHEELGPMLRDNPKFREHLKQKYPWLKPGVEEFEKRQGKAK